MRSPYRLEREQIIGQPRSEIFSFFSQPRNLERLTPGFLRFKILTEEPIVMQGGALIDYQIRLFGVSMRWRTRIERFEPETCFVDTQLRGPYRSWVHTHEFEDVPGGTRMRDIVEYEVGWGPLGGPAHRLFVRRSLRRIFDFRRTAVEEVFGG